MPHPMRLLLFGGQDHLSPAAEVGLLIPRLAFGLGLALAHGFGKLPPSEGFIGGVEGMGFPLPTVFAWAAGLSEFAGALLVAVGLFTRPAALFAAGTMAVAFFVAHSGDPFSDREMSMLYGTFMLGFCLTGSGKLSMDGLIRKTTAAEPQASRPNETAAA